jgi:hypothetical protein
MPPIPAKDRHWLAKGISQATAQNCVGEVLYPKIHALHPKLAGKITGMIICGMSIKECDELLDNEEKFLATVKEAVSVLEKHAVTGH